MCANLRIYECRDLVRGRPQRSIAAIYNGVTSIVEGRERNSRRYASFHVEWGSHLLSALASNMMNHELGHSVQASPPAAARDWGERLMTDECLREAGKKILTCEVHRIL